MSKRSSGFLEGSFRVTFRVTFRVSLGSRLGFHLGFHLGFFAVSCTSRVLSGFLIRTSKLSNGFL